MHREADWLTPTGGLLIAVGLILAGYGLLSSGAPAYSDTLNLGLLNDKSNFVILGGFAFTSGSVFLAVAALIDRITRLAARGSRLRSKPVRTLRPNYLDMVFS